MDISAFRNLADLEMESSFHYESFEQPSVYDDGRPLKQLRTSHHVSSALQFDAIPTYYDNKLVSMMKPKEEEAFVVSEPVACLSSTHHSLAEKKRREKLSQRFVALSALIPGLKKMDKASILGDAIEHMKGLEERVKGLEERARKRRRIEPVVFNVKKEEGGDDDDFPVIRARFCDKELLVSVHCRRGRGVFEKIVGEVENMQFCVVNSSLMSYGDSCLSITLTAEKDKEDNMNIEQLVENLQGLLKMIL
ncbi:transcription factor bHLH25-like [Salvia splendens]|uniref:transcription factor bHLH25-like n=1 Tax=Salvia splendens TaxID=180675 RepID=UPI001C2559F5|nr:transcription factor bHLH25-like [Salvia splendens]